MPELPSSENPAQNDSLETARRRLESILARNPLDTAARIELSDILYRQNHARESVQVLQQAARNLPRNAPLIVQLVQRLIVRGDTPAARECLDFLAQAPDPPVELLLVQARMRWLLGEVPLAAQISSHAAQRGLPEPDDYVFHAMLLKFIGRMDEAGQWLDRCMQLWPQAASPLVAWAQLRRQTPHANRLDALRRILHRPTKEPLDGAAAMERAEVLHAVFKTLDDLGLHADAWPALVECNALMHRALSYDAQADTLAADAFIEASRALPSSTGDARVHEGPLPIFILGMPRSGTTLLEHMLSSHSDVVSAGEILDFWRQLHLEANVPQEGMVSTLELLRRAPGFDYHALGRRYLQQTQWRAGAHRYFVDKTPINVRMVPFIRRALPKAPILHLVRDPMDVCFSNFKAMFGDASSYSYDMHALVNHYAGYVRITEHWRKHWPGAMLDVNYESLVRDPETAMRKILAHCGLEMQAACLRPERNDSPVATPSSVQVREPIHTRGIGQWKDYAEQLEPLRQMLQDRSLLKNDKVA